MQGGTTVFCLWTHVRKAFAGLSLRRGVAMLTGMAKQAPLLK